MLFYVPAHRDVTEFDGICKDLCNSLSIKMKHNVFQGRLTASLIERKWRKLKKKKKFEIHDITVTVGCLEFRREIQK